MHFYYTMYTKLNEMISIGLCYFPKKLAIIPFKLLLYFFCMIFEQVICFIMKLLFYFLLLLYVPALSQSKIISEIEIQNTKRLDKNFLLNTIQTKLGSVLDSLKLNQDIIVLSRLNGVSKVDFTVLKLIENKYLLKLNFIEKEAIIPIVNFSKVDNLIAFTIGGYDYNFLGKNNVIGGFYRYNGFNSLGFQLSFPTLISTKIGLETNIQQLASKEPVFFSNQFANYKYVNTAIELLINIQIDHSKLIKFGNSYFNEKYDYLDGAIANEIPLNYSVNKNLLKFQFVYNKIKYEYYKLNGFKNDFHLEYIIPSKSNQNNNFSIVFNDFNFYKDFGKTNWANRLRLGIATNNDTPFAPFAVDNNINIRGVGFIIDRGTAMAVLNSELRQTLFEKKWFVVQGNAFIDAGSWRNPGGDFKGFLSQKNIRIYPGLGLRFIHKTIYNAVFRIDYGFGITPNASNGIVFGIGQYF